MQIGEVAARTELSLRTIRHYEETGLVVPSARSQGGFRLYTETDVARLMVIRRMKPLGFTLEQMRDLLDATDRLDAVPAPRGEERAALLARVRGYERSAAEQIGTLRTQLSRAEDFARTLRSRLGPAPDAADAPLWMTWDTVTLDCPDPLALAEFYRAATGAALHPASNADFAALAREGAVALGFQRVAGHRAPTWPDAAVPQQLHLCFTAEGDLDEAEARLLALGAGRPEHQPRPGRCRVLTDPAGHPFRVRGA